MAIIWPVTLPQEQFVDLTDQRVDNRVTSENSAGAPKVRKRYTGVVRELSIPIIMNGTQRTAFDTFYNSTLSHGTLEFEWDDPVDDSTVEFQFVSPPQFRLLHGHSDPTKRIWSGTLNLRILP